MRQSVFLLISILILSGCGLFDNKQDPEDFGFEEGYFIYNLSKDKIPWTRNRNYVSLEFYEGVSEKKLHEILKEYNLKYEGQVFPVKHIFAQVINKPAEEYYTTYGDSTLPVLGNRPEVRYALPVFMNEFWDPIMITNKILMRFDGLNEERELHIINSLIVNDNLTRAEDGPGFPTRYRLLVNKNTPKNPFTLANEYNFIRAVEYSELYTAFRINFY